MARSATSARGKAVSPVTRIRHSRDYERILKGGVRRSRTGFTLVGAAGKNGARLGLIVSKSFGRAVDRNRARRIVREGVRLHSEAFKDAHDYVVILRQGLISQPTREIWGALAEAAQQINQQIDAGGRPRERGRKGS